MAHTYWKIWASIWFRASCADGMGLLRLLFYLFFFMVVHVPSSSWSEVDRVFWMPLPLFDVFSLPVFSSDILELLQTVFFISLILSCIGLATRFSTITAFILGLYLLGLPYNFFGKTDHDSAINVLFMGIFAFSRCGDAWSVDQLIKKYRSSTVSNRADNGEYTWPVQLMRVTHSMVFFAAGYSKLHASGLEWIFSNTLANNFILHHYIDDGIILDWGLYIAQIQWLCWLIAAGTIIIETGYPLALFGRSLRIILVPSLLFMQIGIWLLLDMFFVGIMICFMVWLPWHHIGRWMDGLYKRLPPHRYNQTTTHIQASTNY